MAELSDFAKAVNEARDPGSSSPERLWARNIAEELRARVIGTQPWHGALGRAAPTHVVHGLHFTVRFGGWVDAPHGNSGKVMSFIHEISGEPCDARYFEICLARFAPREVPHDGPNL